jgi:hypothetical protein
MDGTKQDFIYLKKGVGHLKICIKSLPLQNIFNANKMENYNQAFYETTGYKVSLEIEQVEEEIGDAPKIVIDFVAKFTSYPLQKKKQYLPTLEKYAKQYPLALFIQIALLQLYSDAKKLKEEEALLSMLKQQFPNNMLVLAMLVGNHLKNEKFEEALDMLGATLSLKDAFPEKEIFTASEYYYYYMAAAHYHLVKNEISKIRRILHNFLLLDKDNSNCEIIAKLLIDYNKSRPLMEKMVRLVDGRGARVIPRDGYTIKPLEKEAPYHHDLEIELLKQYDIHDISHDLLEEILQLPHDTLKEDLKNLFLYASHAWGMEEEYEEDFHYHALILLTWIGAKDALPLILDTLRQETDGLDYLYEGSLEYLIESVYLLGESQVPLLVSFAKERYRTGINKELIAKVLTQIGLHQPERRDEMIACLLDICQEYIQNLTDKGLNDAFHSSLFLGGLVKLRATETLPTLHQMNEMGLYDKAYMGDWDIIELYFESPIENRDVIALPENIIEQYTRDHRTRKATQYSDAPTVDSYIIEKIMENLDEDDYAILEQLKEIFVNKLHVNEKKGNMLQDTFKPATPQLPANNTQKVYPNDPCPCGSGKKYKKCCKE